LHMFVELTVLSICVQAHGYTLQNPMTFVQIRFDIGFEDEANTHGVSSSLCDVDWCSDGSSKLKLVCLNRNNLN